MFCSLDCLPKGLVGIKGWFLLLFAGFFPGLFIARIDEMGLGLFLSHGLGIWSSGLVCDAGRGLGISCNFLVLGLKIFAELSFVKYLVLMMDLGYEYFGIYYQIFLY